MAFDPENFFAELKTLTERGVPKPNILVSSRAQLLLSFHKLQDKLEEARLGKHSFGSTQSGIAPFYSDKYAKKNIQISELYSPGLPGKVARLAEEKNIFFKAFYGVDNAVDAGALFEYLNLGLGSCGRAGWLPRYAEFSVAGREEYSARGPARLS